MAGGALEDRAVKDAGAHSPVARARARGRCRRQDVGHRDDPGERVGRWQIDRAIRATREAAGLPAAFRFHDCRHCYASLLIADGADVKVVQARLRHASATTTLNTYAHLWPDTEESTRATVGAAMAARADSLRTGRTS
ncbi:tyrosine-type recombinase/integrase [Cellulomonas humilata]|uniref:tyrosine-type recombinase/integrase n=1 Tax=Cellulomonas humilata TaxID=144055 RepID=UPI0031B5D3B5